MSLDLSKYTKRISADLEKLGIKEKLASGMAKLSARADAAKIEAEALRPKLKNAMDSASSLTKVLAGAVGTLGEYYFPSELIGGTCPRVAGEEEEIVWNAAAEACDTERVHVVWQSVDSKIWYIAVRSSELASHPDTWCPFASLLPGAKDAATPPVCYTYYSDEMATMMTVTPDGLQIYRGTTLVVRAKAERTARELGNVPVIELTPDQVMKLAPVPWYSVSLFEDRARRILAAAAVFSAITLAGLTFLIWLFASMALITARHDLSDTLTRTQDKTTELMRTSEKLRTSPMREQLAKFADLNDGLLAVNGLLEVYEVKDGKVRWRAIVPTNVTADRINELGGKNIESTGQGVAIGNAAEIEFEAISAGKK